MLLKLLYLGCIGTVVTAAATPWSAEARTKTDITKTSIQRRQELQEATLPMNDADRAERAREIETTRSGFLYGPSRLGNTSFYPAGPLGNAVVQADVEGGRVDAAAILKAVREDLAAVNKTMREVSLWAWSTLTSVHANALCRRAASKQSQTMPCFTMVSGRRRRQMESFRGCCQTIPRICCSQWRGYRSTPIFSGEQSGRIPGYRSRWTMPLFKK